MALKTYKPTTNGQRQLVLVDRSGLHKGGPVKSLTEGKTSKGGRNNTGRVVVRWQGGGHKQRYRLIDFKRNRFNDPTVATYNVDRNINYTNVCVYKCKFCAFYREPGDPEGYLLPFEEIGRKVEETLALNGTGILMQGGVHPDLPISFYEDLLRYLRSNYPACHVHAFSPPEIKFIARKERMSFYEVIARLKAAGLGAQETAAIRGGNAAALLGL